ncbi:unnamed protein product [Pieris macdunnoughi]|uniref:Uncharacterized protein n=1 Tax=Pieris macdunnoughi TaxID=345717 RepID=A0A821RCK9_9NEOP|nr:unnamed protein product [Pieris macdunnoughi]
MYRVDRFNSHCDGPLVRRLSQGSEFGPVADECCEPRPPLSASAPEAGVGVCGGAAGGPRGGARDLSPDRTPTNEVPSIPLQSVSKDFVERAFAGAVHRDSVSSASTPSTLDRTTIHNPTPLHQLSPASEAVLSPAVEETVEEPRPSTPERLTPQAEMRLALDQGKDMLVEQEKSLDGGSDRWSFRAACQRSLVRRVASADAVTLCRAPPRRTAPHTTSHSSVYAWKAPENEMKLSEMEQLARAEVLTMRSRTRSQCQNGKILGFLRRRASSDSPRREPFIINSRPLSPRRTTEKHLEKRFWKQVTRRRQSCGSISQI